MLGISDQDLKSRSLLNFASKYSANLREEIWKFLMISGRIYSFLDYVHMRGERSHERSPQTGMRFHFGWKSHFGVQSALYLCSHELRWNETQNGMDFISVILTEMKFQTGMRFSCEHNLPETKWISADSLDVAFNAHVRLKLNAGMDFISVILTEMKFHFGW